MRNTAVRTLFIISCIGVVAFLASHQFVHFQSVLENNQPFEVSEIVFAALMLSVLLVAFRFSQSNEKKLWEANRELIKLNEERAKASTELGQSRASLARAQRIAHVGNWDWNIQTGDLAWSDEIYRIFGLAPQQFGATYEAFLNSIHPDDREAVTEAVNQAVYGHIPYSIEHRVIWPDGTVRYVYEQGEVEYTEQDEPTAMSGTVLDITERKQREDQYKTLNAQLENRVLERTAALREEIAVRKAAEKESRALRKKAEGYLSMAGNLLVALDSSGHIEMLNTKGAQILGYASPDDLIGKNWFEVALPASDRPKVQNVFDQIMAGHHGTYEEFENQVLTKSGEIRMMQWHNSILHDENQNIIGILGAATDITEQKHHEKTLLRAKEVAEDANRTKNGFLSNMSHELRTPMNAVLGFTQLIQTNSDNLTAAQAEYLDIILKSGNHLLTLINEILDLSRIEIGALNVELRELSSGGAIDEAASLLMPMAKKHNVEILISDDLDDLPLITADTGRLRQILVNLVSNAIKYNQSGGKVFISAAIYETSMLRISIRDTGNGIPTNRCHELFQAFNRLDAENSGIEGTGVGLVLTKNLVELMNGRIGYDSIEGQGSTFWVDLPALIKDKTPEVTEEPPKPTAKTHHHILCIENNPTDLRLFQDIVAGLDHVEMTPAPDLQSGLDFVQTQTPDLIVIKVAEPCKETSPLQNWCIQQTPAIPIIAMCENQGSRNIKHCDLQTYNACIDKPVDIHDVISALRTVLHLPDQPGDNVVRLKTNKAKP